MRKIILIILTSVLNIVIVHASVDTTSYKQPGIKWQQFISPSPIGFKLSFPSYSVDALEQMNLVPHFSIGYLNYVERNDDGFYKYNIGVRYGMVELHRNLLKLGKAKVELTGSGGIAHYKRMVQRDQPGNRLGLIFSGGIQASMGSFVCDVRLNKGGTIPDVYPSYSIGVQGMRGRSFLCAPGIIATAGFFWFLMLSIFGFG